MKIRLTEQEMDGIIKALEPFLINCVAKLYLYGSRSNFESKGGDIDLLLIIDSNNKLKFIREIKHKILAEIKKNMGEQKIDLLISNTHALKTDKFLQTIFPKAVLLREFN